MIRRDQNPEGDAGLRAATAAAGDRLARVKAATAVVRRGQKEQPGARRLLCGLRSRRDWLRRRAAAVSPRASLPHRRDCPRASASQSGSRVGHNAASQGEAAAAGPTGGACSNSGVRPPRKRAVETRRSTAAQPSSSGLTRHGAPGSAAARTSWSRRGQSRNARTRARRIARQPPHRAQDPMAPIGWSVSCESRTLLAPERWVISHNSTLALHPNQPRDPSARLHERAAGIGQIQPRDHVAAACLRAHGP